MRRRAADNVGNTAVNLAESRSRIRDADYGAATAELARSMIIQQAGTAVLAQANQVTQTVLALLRLAHWCYARGAALLRPLFVYRALKEFVLGSNHLVAGDDIHLPALVMQGIECPQSPARRPR